MKLAAVVLGAGASRRFGSPKQLHLFEGEPLLRRAAATARSVARTTVVLGAHAEAVRPVLEGLDVDVVIAADWEEGMAASLRAGVRAVGDVSGVLILTCDQPRVTVEHLRALVDAWEPGGIAASDYGDALGPPCLFDRTHFPELLSLTGDVGARRLLDRHPCRTVSFPEGRYDIDRVTSCKPSP